jgi:hypothetical protein
VATDDPLLGQLLQQLQPATTAQNDPLLAQLQGQQSATGTQPDQPETWSEYLSGMAGAVSRGVLPFGAAEQLKGVVQGGLAKVRGEDYQPAHDKAVADAEAEAKQIHERHPWQSGAAEGVGAAATGLATGGALGAARGLPVAGRALGAVGDFLSAAPGMQVASGAVGGAVGEGTDNPWLGMAAGLGVPTGVALARKLTAPGFSRLPQASQDLMGRIEQNYPNLYDKISAGQKLGSGPLKMVESSFEQLPLTSASQDTRNLAEQEAFTGSVLGHSQTPGNSADPATLLAREQAIGRVMADTRGNTPLDPFAPIGPPPAPGAPPPTLAQQLAAIGNEACSPTPKRKSCSIKPALFWLSAHGPAPLTASSSATGTPSPEAGREQCRKEPRPCRPAARPERDGARRPHRADEPGGRGGLYASPAQRSSPMPRDASGNYTLPEAPFQPNTLAQSARVNHNFTDIAAALSDSFSVSLGQPLQGPLNMNGQNITNLGTLVGPVGRDRRRAGGRWRLPHHHDRHDDLRPPRSGTAPGVDQGGFVGSWDVVSNAYSGFWTNPSGVLTFGTADPGAGTLLFSRGTLDASGNMAVAGTFLSNGALSAPAATVSGTVTAGAITVSGGVSVGSDISVAGRIYAAGIGVVYQGVGGSNGIAFKWTGTAVDVYVDTSRVGRMFLDTSLTERLDALEARIAALEAGSG